MGLTRLRRVFAVSVGGLALVAVGSGVAQAASATLAISDKASFAGTGKPGSTKGTFVFATTRCAQVSDGENQTFPCRINGNLTLGSPITGNAILTSADGAIQWKFTLTGGPKTYKMTGRGAEKDAGDPGVPPPKPYPCVVNGVLNVSSTPSGFTFTGNITVAESSTAP
jgi:hypothetical protein